MGRCNNPAPRDIRSADLETAKRLKLEELAAARWKAETGGMNFFGVPIATDDRSKSLLFAAYGEAMANPAFVDRWKGADGVFRPVDATTVIGLYNALREHVAACFAKEAALLDLLAGCKNKEEIAGISWNMDLPASFSNWNDITEVK